MNKNDYKSLYESMETLVLYPFSDGSPISRIVRALSDDVTDRRALARAAGELLTEHFNSGQRGNTPWESAVVRHLVETENPFSLSCEKSYSGNFGLIREAAVREAKVLRELLLLDFSSCEEEYPEIGAITHADASVSGESGYYGHLMSEALTKLCDKLKSAATDDEFTDDGLAKFYDAYGVGMLGLHKAFRLDDTGEIEAICAIPDVSLDDLVGYETQKKELIANTKAFIKGLPANNCLLYGEAGTGKSSSVKAITNRFYGDGLRVIEIYKHQFIHLNKLIAKIKNRRYRFILYMDDLSFEDFETEYKYLKAVIEGGLEERPKNVLIYATSNRRHLVRESFNDKRDADDLHRNDTVQEKLSLYHRFGVTIYFGAPEKNEFDSIVLALAKRGGIDMSEKELLLAANSFELYHGGRSGRTARQFIDSLLGSEEAL